MEFPEPAYRGDERYVFVCYSHADTGVVYPEMRWLQQQGIRLWYDAGISAGAVWRAEIAEAIRGAAHVLVYLSRASIASAHCLREIDYALDHDVPILPVYLDDSALPAGLDLSLNRLQALRREDTASYRSELIGALGRSTPASAARAHERSTTTRRPVAFALLVVAVLITLGISFWMIPREVQQGSRAAPTRSVSVATFDVIGSQPEAAALAATLREDVVAHLSSYRELRTLDVTDESATSYIVRGGIQTGPAAQTIRMRLQRTEGAETVWSRNFEVPIGDTSAEQQLPRTIARFVRLQLLQDQECQSIKAKAKVPEAAEILCTALADNYRINQGGGTDPEHRRVLSERVLTLDPSLVDTYWLLASYWILEKESTTDTFESNAARGIELLQRGLAIAPDDPVIIAQRGWMIEWDLDLDYEAAKASQQQAIEHDPTHPKVRWWYANLGMIELQQGNLPAAIDWLHRAVTVFDADARIWLQYSGVLNAAGRFEEAIAAADAGLDLTFNGFFYDVLVMNKTEALVALGHTESAERLVESAGLGPLAAMGAAILLEHDDLVGKWLRDTNLLHASPAWVSAACSNSGDLECAFSALHRGIDTREAGVLSNLRTLRALSVLRHHPRWAEVMSHLEREEAKGRLSP